MAVPKKAARKIPNVDLIYLLRWYAMPRLKILFDDTHIHVCASGRSSYMAKLDFWQKVVKAYEEHHCFNILGEFFQNSRPLGTIEAYDIYTVLKEAGVTRKHKIAWVISDSSHLESMSFAETVFRNRVLSGVRAFTDITAAKNWLLNKSGA